MKCLFFCIKFSTQCRSREGAWIEIFLGSAAGAVAGGRSREGAWIEILIHPCGHKYSKVAPVRERGLKYQLALAVINTIKRRSREGAWIEINVIAPTVL